MRLGACTVAATVTVREMVIAMVMVKVTGREMVI